MKNLTFIHKLLLGIFALFLLFSACVILIATFTTSPLLSFTVFVVLIYIVYYLGLRYFLD
ncbi:conserved hypothetical protein [Lebetimonas natsushimae]|uniref:Lipoprotein n=1 Tax=Lebetimonas natsushimae TaxID=1936991 RepID=A0A292YHD6_9BACT|nr:hypothetical protein [Lebetimonas natsushimae]GAX88309.1 conserved hypothetical protein [Lebetimonas natsushimae]